MARSGLTIDDPGWIIPLSIGGQTIRRGVCIYRASVLFSGVRRLPTGTCDATPHTLLAFLVALHHHVIEFYPYLLCLRDLACEGLHRVPSKNPSPKDWAKRVMTIHSILDGPISPWRHLSMRLVFFSRPIDPQRHSSTFTSLASSILCECCPGG